jgi:hypothetical protein
MNGRKIKIEVEELNGDGSEFELVCIVDELIVERSGKNYGVSYCFEDVVDLFGDFFRMVSDKYNERLSLKMESMVSFIEPLFVGILTIIIGVILVSVMLPLVSVMGKMV